MEENQLLQFKLSEKLIDWYNAIYWTLKIDKQSISPLDYGKNQEIDVGPNDLEINVYLSSKNIYY